MPARSTRLLALLLFFSSSASLFAQQLLLAPASAPVTSRPAELNVIVLNDTTEQLHYSPPKQLGASVQIDGTSREVMLVIVEDHPILIAPGAFSKVRYQLSIDDSFIGEARLKLHESSVSIELNLLSPTTKEASAQEKLVEALKADPKFNTELGLVEYLANHVKPYEPMYFLYGNETPNAKFQLSFKYQVFDNNGWVVKNVPPLSGLYLSYSQTSFWDLDGESSPFFDNSYRPGVMFAYEQLDRFFEDSNGKRSLPNWVRFDFAGGIQHESNGRSGADSRSMNYAYIQPSVTLGDRREWFVSIGPRLLTYVGDLSDNEDIEGRPFVVGGGGAQPGGHAAATAVDGAAARLASRAEGA
ncbi:MAG TPA: phospholipase A [Tepidisphaeraceae bacterium]|nr:phospholipase A [Tepidisphaeraceae bacterium]